MLQIFDSKWIIGNVPVKGVKIFYTLEPVDNNICDRKYHYFVGRLDYDLSNHQFEHLFRPNAPERDREEHQRIDADALRFATAAAALSVTKAGAQTSIPDRATTEAFIDARK